MKRKWNSGNLNPRLIALYEYLVEKYWSEWKEIAKNIISWIKLWKLTKDDTDLIEEFLLSNKWRNEQQAAIIYCFKEDWVAPELLWRVKWYTFFNPIDRNSLYEIALVKIYELLWYKKYNDEEIENFIRRYKKEIDEEIERALLEWLWARWLINRISIFIENKILEEKLQNSGNLKNISSKNRFRRWEKPKPLWWLEI